MDACPICEGVQTAFFARKDAYDFVVCRNCGFVFLFPMPDEAALAALYDDTAFSVGRYPKAKSRMRRAMLRALRLWPHFVGRDAIDVGCGGGFVAESMRRLGAPAWGPSLPRRLISLCSAFSRTEQVFTTTNSASSSSSAWVYPAAVSTSSIRRESCTFIWQPKVCTT